ncbi:MAG: NAD(P)-dependent oxidoreductase [Kurthia sp.]|nr:NAD(P)-dependent oxidoreductase [Candidatus Kurthia equi]
MKIAIIGATGKAGNKILKEAIAAGLDTTAIVRNSKKIAENIPVIEKDIMDLTADDVKEFDTVVSAFGAPVGHQELHVTIGRHLIDIFTGLDNRLIVVGGAGSLYVDPDKKIRVMDTPDFPEAFLDTATNQGKNFEDLQASTINWTFVSPSAFFDVDGPRTGKYSKGEDHLLVNEKGESYVSYADFAVAIIDEIKAPSHIKSRFTVASNN